MRAALATTFRRAVHISASPRVYECSQIAKANDQVCIRYIRRRDMHAAVLLRECALMRQKERREPRVGVVNGRAQ